MALSRSPFLQSRTEGGIGPLVLADGRFAPGNVFFVQSTHTNKGDTAGRGQTPEMPFATIDYAVGQCTADQGDLILVLPGHVETVSAAAGLALDVAGIKILGLGSGSKQPKIDFTTAAGADMDVDAADITMENFQFEASFADLTAVVDVNAKDFTLRRCRFLEPTVDENFLICILGATSTTSDGLLVEDCEFRTVDAANTHGISLTSGTPDHVIIRRNLFLGVFETGAILGSGAATQLAVYDNFINNTSADADECISLAGTGVVCRNVVGNNLAAAATTNITCGTTMTMAENYSTDKGDVQGVLDPIAT